MKSKNVINIKIFMEKLFNYYANTNKMLKNGDILPPFYSRNGKACLTLLKVDGRITRNWATQLF